MELHQWYQWAFWAESPENLRNLAFALGALLAALIGTPLAIFRTIAATRSANSSFNQQVTNAFSTAVGQLGSNNDLEVRIGAIYSMERVARENKSLHQPIMETLTAYIREASHRVRKEIDAEKESRPLAALQKGKSDPPILRELDADIQAALTVLCRRHVPHEHRKKTLYHYLLQKIRLKQDYVRAISSTAISGYYFNMSNCYLARADATLSSLSNVNFSHCDLRAARLSSCDLAYSNFSSANLSLADLELARMRGANMAHCDLRGCSMDHVDLTSANLRGSNLSHAIMHESTLSSATLAGANLQDADLEGADLTNAILSGATMCGASLSGANLTGAILLGTYFRPSDLEQLHLSDKQLNDVKVVDDDAVQRASE